MTFVAEVVVSLKPLVNDPQGITIRDGLRRLGFPGVGSVRVGKHIEIEVDAPDEATASAAVAEMCERLLRNPVIEDYRIGVLRVQTAPV